MGSIAWARIPCDPTVSQAARKRKYRARLQRYPARSRYAPVLRAGAQHCGQASSMGAMASAARIPAPASRWDSIFLGK